jgi:hypothetical protein
LKIPFGRKAIGKYEKGTDGNDFVYEKPATMIFGQKKK